MKTFRRIVFLVIVVTLFSSCTNFDSEDEFDAIENTQSYGGDDDELLSDDDFS